MSENDRTKLLADKEPPPDTAELVVREYLNDFEEFASAINCGLLQSDGKSRNRRKTRKRPKFKKRSGYPINSE
jgi:hypothetical protein